MKDETNFLLILTPIWQRKWRCSCRLRRLGLHFPFVRALIYVATSMNRPLKSTWTTQIKLLLKVMMIANLLLWRMSNFF